MTLMPVSNIVGRRLEGVERRRVAVDLPAVGDLAELLGRDVERLADHVEHVAEHHVADRHGDAAAGVAHRRCRGAGRRSA